LLSLRRRAALIDEKRDTLQETSVKGMGNLRERFVRFNRLIDDT
jgi:hypothetical protein